MCFKVRRNLFNFEESKMILGFSSVLFLDMFLSQAEHVILNVSYFIMTAEKRSGSWHEHLINIHNVGRQQSSRENFKKINLICCLPWYTLAVCAEDKAAVQISLSKNKSQRLLGKKKVCLREKKAMKQGKKNDASVTDCRGCKEMRDGDRT